MKTINLKQEEILQNKRFSFTNSNFATEYLTGSGLLIMEEFRNGSLLDVMLNIIYQILSCRPPNEKHFSVDSAN